MTTESDLLQVDIQPKEEKTLKPKRSTKYKSNLTYQESIGRFTVYPSPRVKKRKGNKRKRVTRRVAFSKPASLPKIK